MEMEDRFKFKVWDYLINRFCEEWQSKDGRLSGFVRLDINEETGIANRIFCSLSFFSDKNRFHIIQSAGIRDKNKKLIFEKSILKSVIDTQDEYYKVIQQYGCFGMKNIAGGRIATFLHLDHYLIEEKQEVEIIGNEFENPKLLEIDG